MQQIQQDAAGNTVDSSNIATQSIFDIYSFSMELARARTFRTPSRLLLTAAGVGLSGFLFSHLLLFASSCGIKAELERYSEKIHGDHHGSFSSYFGASPDHHPAVDQYYTGIRWASYNQMFGPVFRPLIHLARVIFVLSAHFALLLTAIAVWIVLRWMEGRVLVLVQGNGLLRSECDVGLLSWRAVGSCDAAEPRREWPFLEGRFMRFCGVGNGRQVGGCCPARRGAEDPSRPSRTTPEIGAGAPDQHALLPGRRPTTTALERTDSPQLTAYLQKTALQRYFFFTKIFFFTSFPLLWLGFCRRFENDFFPGFGEYSDFRDLLTQTTYVLDSGGGSEAQFYQGREQLRAMLEKGGAVRGRWRGDGGGTSSTSSFSFEETRGGSTGSAGVAVVAGAQSAWLPIRGPSGAARLRPIGVADPARLRPIVDRSESCATRPSRCCQPQRSAQHQPLEEDFEVDLVLFASDFTASNDANAISFSTTSSTTSTSALAAAMAVSPVCGIDRGTGRLLANREQPLRFDPTNKTCRRAYRWTLVEGAVTDGGGGGEHKFEDEHADFIRKRSADYCGISKNGFRVGGRGGETILDQMPVALRERLQVGEFFETILEDQMPVALRRCSFTGVFFSPPTGAG